MKTLFFTCISFILCVLLSGCAGIGKVYKYEDGIKNTLYEIELNKEGALTYKDKDIEMQIDTRKPTMWERFIQPIIGKAGEQVQATTQVK